MIIEKNKIKCKHCDAIVISKGPEMEFCDCNACGAGGGSSWLDRKGKEGVDYDELSVISPNSVIFEGIKEDSTDKKGN